MVTFGLPKLPTWNSMQKGCVISLVAFVRLFSSVCFQMSDQFACFRGCIVTLNAFVWLFSSVHYQMCPQIVCMSGGICHIGCICMTFLHCTMRSLYSRMPLYPICPCIRYRGINYPPVSTEFEVRSEILSQTLLIQGHILLPCSWYRGIKEGKSQN